VRREADSDKGSTTSQSLQAMTEHQISDDQRRRSEMMRCSEPSTISEAKHAKPLTKALPVSKAVCASEKQVVTER
jgi:hypothetical protein